MTQENTIKSKSKKLAVRIVKLYNYLTSTSKKREYVMSKQILRSGTSIGANIAESECAISRKDFISKIYIALKECVETIYWLELLADTGFLEEKEFQSIYNDCIELKKMMQSITKTMSSEKEKNRSETTLNSTLHTSHSTLIRKVLIK